MGDDPELGTNDDWREAMAKARRKLRLSQRELGARIGTSQNVISQLESGGIRSSAFVMPICRLLSIEPPQHHESEEMRLWNERGRRLFAKDPEKLQRFLRLVEDMLGEDHASADEHAPDPKPRSVKTRPRAK